VSENELDAATAPPAPAAPAIPSRPAWRRVLWGPRELRAGWRFAIFLTILTLLSLGGRVVASLLHYEPVWTADAFLWAECIQFALTLGAVALMGRLERRSLARYGRPSRVPSAGISGPALCGAASPYALWSASSRSSAAARFPDSR
jgi:hypothetical protein